MASIAKPHSPAVEEALGAVQVAEILGVHPRTLGRRKSSRKKLRPLESQREAKLRLIWKELLDLFTPENAVRWLEGAVPALEGRRPLDVMAEDGGLDRVLDTIGRMSWGIPA